MITRRDFVAASSLALAAGLVARAQPEQPEPAKERKPLPTVTVGRTGRIVPRLGLGTAFLGMLDDEDKGVAVAKHAIEVGVRYLDTAPSYSRGASERRTGIAMAASGVPRGDFYVATKTLQRGADGARREVEESLKRMQLEYFDAVQVHAVAEDVDSVFAPDSVLTGLEKAREEGLLRYIGVTGHRNPEFQIRAVQRYEFATALVPINPVDTKHRSFIREFLPVAGERGVCVIAMKIYAAGALLRQGRAKAPELVRYALSQPHVGVVVPGCDELWHVDEAYEGAAGFTPMTDEEKAELEERVGPHMGRESEWYKQPG